MPRRYEFEIGGKVYEVEADRMPSGAQMRAIAARMGGGERKPARPEDFMDPQPAAPEGSALGRFAAGAWENLNPVTALSGLARAAASPWETGKALVGAQVEQGRKAYDAAREGRYSEAAGHAGAAMLPVLGPVAANIGEGIAETGDVAGGVGRATGLIAPIAGGRAAVARAQKVGAKTGAAVKAALDPGAATADAVRWALKNGVPVDAATATGNAAVKGLRGLADRSIGGAAVAKTAAEKRAASMAKLGRNLAREASPSGMATAETAGEGVRASVEGVIRRESEAADAAYARVRDAEQAAPIEAVKTGTKRVDTGILDAKGEPFKRTEPVIEQQQMAVPLAGVKDALRPTFDRLMRKRELTGTLMGDEGRAATALDALLSAGDHAPLSVVDAALGDLKAAARGAAMPELRTSGQGVAALAVKELENVVQARAQAAGVWDDLRAGRDATIRKWTAAETLDGLRAEPVQTFRALTQDADAAVDKLRAVKKLAPGELPAIGRAYLEGLMDTATAEGGFGREARLWSDWQRLGPETKKMLYPDPALRESLDRFFLVGKKLAENPNPSGSGYIAALSAQGTALLFEPVSGAATVIAGGVLSKALNSPKVARLLTEALQTPATSTAAKSTAARLRAALAKYAPTAAPGVGLATSQTQERATP